MAHRVFIYGTLKKGQPNNAIITDPSNGKATFICCGKTVSKYPLVIDKVGNLPSALFHDEGIGHNIFGEIWEVDDEMRQFLDDFEGHPTFYERKQIPVVALPDVGDNSETNTAAEGNEELCWFYSVRHYDRKLLELPYYSSYDNYGEHGMPCNVEAYFEKRDQLKFAHDTTSSSETKQEQPQ